MDALYLWYSSADSTQFTTTEFYSDVTTNSNVGAYYYVSEPLEKPKVPSPPILPVRRIASPRSPSAPGNMLALTGYWRSEIGRRAA